MKNHRRDFLRKIGFTAGISASLPLWNIEQLKATPQEDESFWELIRAAYSPSPDFINLENGYFSPQPLETLTAHHTYQRQINSIPSYFMRVHQWEEKKAAKEKLAAFAGVSPDEIAITRNTTESLDTVILGLKMKKGEEAIMTDQCYLSMVESFRQKARREGTVNKMIQLPLHPESDDEMVELYEKAITKKTRVLLVTHLINLTGQVLPVRKIADMAHSYGVEVICDSAHAFAQLDFNIPDLGVDYLGASLHKWLCTPLGAGILYVKKDKIERVWPLFGDDSRGDDEIEKFEHIGTHPVHTHMAIANAIDFHHAVGTSRKRERLLELRNYWVDQVKELDKVTLNMPLEENRSSALGNISVAGYTPEQLSTYLFEKHNIFTVAIHRDAVQGVRVTPHLYTTFTELDTFIKAIKNA